MAAKINTLLKARIPAEIEMPHLCFLMVLAHTLHVLFLIAIHCYTLKNYSLHKQHQNRFDRNGMEEKHRPTIPPHQQIMVSIFSFPLPIIFHMHSIYPHCTHSLDKILFTAPST